MSARRARARVAVQDRSGVFCSYDLFFGRESTLARKAARQIGDQANVVVRSGSLVRASVCDAFVSIGL